MIKSHSWTLLSKPAVVATLCCLPLLPASLAQTIEALKGINQDNNFDQLYTSYTFTVGEGFDPTKDFSGLKIKVQRTPHPGSGTSAATPLDDGPGFRVRYGIVYLNSPTNTFAGQTAGNVLMNFTNSVDSLDFAGDGNLYDIATNIVGYVSDIQGNFVIKPQSGYSTSP